MPSARQYHFQRMQVGVNYNSDESRAGCDYVLNDEEIGLFSDEVVVSCAPQMSRARIPQGVWTRNVPWEKAGVWRTDMFKTVLADPRLKKARFILADGPTVLVSAEDLRAVLVGGRDHYYGNQIWGPFNIDPNAGTIDGKNVQMEIVT